MGAEAAGGGSAMGGGPRGLGALCGRLRQGGSADGGCRREHEGTGDGRRRAAGQTATRATAGGRQRAGGFRLGALGAGGPRKKLAALAATYS